MTALLDSLSAFMASHPLLLAVETFLVAVLGLWCVRLVRRAERLRESQGHHESLFRNNLDAIVVLDAQGAIDGSNGAFAALSGRAEADLVGRSFGDFVRPSDRGLVLSTLRRTLQEGIGRSVQATLRRPDSRDRKLEMTTVPVVTRGTVTGAYLVLRDISEQKALERRLEDKALHDPLTGLPNRALFTDRIQHAMARVRRRGGTVALLYLDLDDFKNVNDTAGHAAGDALLCEVAARLSCFLREGDTVARLGGDEFAIMLEGIEGAEQAIDAAERVLELFEAPVHAEGGEHQVGASIGIALSSEETDHADELLREADLAMYEAKRNGGRRYRIFDRELASPTFETEAQLLGELRQALEDGEFVLHYQPIVDLAGTRIVGVEGLIRWRHDRHGLLPPGVFLPAATESGLILAIDRWVIARACGEVAGWMEAGLVDDAFFLSLNLGGGHLNAPDVGEAVSGILRDQNFPAERLQLELGESEAASCLDCVRNLKAIGVRVALDDFGTGYTSLAYLKNTRFDVLKVDRSLVTPLAGDPTALATVRTVLTLADLLGLEVIVEGVEDPAQLRRLQEVGGRLVQGFYFGAPVPAEEIRALIREGFPPEWTARHERRLEESGPQPDAAKEAAPLADLRPADADYSATPRPTGTEGGVRPL